MMPRLTLTLSILVATPAAVTGQAPNPAVTMPPAAEVNITRAVDEAVSFLVAHQNADGSFGRYTSGRSWEVMASVPGSLHAFKAATTALCWLGLHDQRTRSPESEAAARKALGYLADHVRVKRANGMEMYNVWSFGYGLRALSEALTTEAPGADPAKLRARAEEIIGALEIYQTPDGGWGYYDFNAQSFNPSYTSMSFTTATILVGLHRAREAGIAVPDALIETATRSIRRCRKADGSYIYGPDLQYEPNMGVNQPKGSAMRSPACNLALRLFSQDISDDDLRTGLDFVVKHHRFAVAGVRRPIPHEAWYQVSGYFYLYGHQYAALNLELLPRKDRERYGPEIVKGILKTRQPDGSFWDYPLYGFHKFYGTGYALIALARCAELAE